MSQVIHETKRRAVHKWCFDRLLSCPESAREFCMGRTAIHKALIEAPADRVRHEWFSVAQRGNGKANVGIYGELLYHYEGGDLLTEIRDCNEVTLRLNCLGGNSKVALEIFHELKQRDTTVVIQRASSAGSIIALCGQRRLIYPDGKVMVHAVHGAVFGMSKAMRDEADRLDVIEQDYVPLYCDATGQPEAVVREWLFDGKDHWFDAQEAVEAGLAHEIIAKPPPIAKATTVEPGQRDDTDLALKLLRCIGPLSIPNREEFFRRIESICSAGSSNGS